MAGFVALANVRITQANCLCLHLWRLASSAAIQRVGEKYFIPQNRITWEREKGRGAKSNWKNCSEDIWFFTVSEDYYFNVDAVMLKRQVIAPYTDRNGEPKDWTESENGRFRVTHPSNMWTDLTVPYWSMPENTDHPTQKPEKLLAKIILASSNAKAISCSIRSTARARRLSSRKSLGGTTWASKSTRPTAASRRSDWSWPPRTAVFRGMSMACFGKETQSQDSHERSTDRIQNPVMYILSYICVLSNLTICVNARLLSYPV